MFFCSTRCRASLMCHPNGRCLLLETLTWPCVAFAPRVSVTFRLEVTEQAEPVQTPRLRCSTHGCCHRAVVAHTAVVTEALQAVQHRTRPLSQRRCKQCSTAHGRCHRAAASSAAPLLFRRPRATALTWPPRRGSPQARGALSRPGYSPLSHSPLSCSPLSCRPLCRRTASAWRARRG